MNNLTDIILTKNSNHNIDETVKSSSAIKYENGSQQVVSKSSIPSISITIDYNGLTDLEFETLRDAYEANYANTFLCDMSINTDTRSATKTILDQRGEFMTASANTWAFKEFEFLRTPSSRINGSITLFTSLYFDFPKFQELYSESSNYSLSTTLDNSFANLLLEDIPANMVTYSYVNNSIFSNVGKSAKYIKDRQDLKRKYTLRWLMSETSFNKLLTYYRKKSGALGVFGMPDYAIDETVLINAGFVSDSMKYSRRIDGLYETELEIIEV